MKGLQKDIKELPNFLIGKCHDKNPVLIKITILDYDGKNLSEKEAKTVEECFPFKETPSVTWINLNGVHDLEIIEKIGVHFNLHPLVLEDIVNTGQRPKYEDYEDYLFIVLKMLYLDEKKEEIKAEQISLIVGSNYVISFQEKGF